MPSGRVIWIASVSSILPCLDLEQKSNRECGCSQERSTAVAWAGAQWVGDVDDGGSENLEISICAGKISDAFRELRLPVPECDS